MHHRILPLAACLAVIGLTAVTSKALGQTRPFQPTYEDGTTRRGQDYRSFHPIGPSALYCQQACLTEPQCHAWSYDSPSVRGDKQPVCWLKSSVPAPTNARGIISGIVRPDSTDAAAVAEGANTNASGAAAPNAPVASGVIEYKRSVQSGVDSLLGHERAWDGNCQPLPSLITITRKPTNGTMWVIQGTSTLPESTPRGGSTGACAGKPMVGNQVMYRSNSDFHGIDGAAYDVTYANGRRQSTGVTINVR